MPPWRRLYDHGLGLLHALQEDVDSARPSLERALDLVPPGRIRERAMVLHALAEVSIREGRTDEALAAPRRGGGARARSPGHPARPRRGARRACGAGRKRPSRCAQAAQASPLDDALWSHLAVAYGSADDPRAALDATTPRLALDPARRRHAARPGPGAGEAGRVPRRRGAGTRRLRAVATARRRARRQERLLAVSSPGARSSGCRCTSTRCRACPDDAGWHAGAAAVTCQATGADLRWSVRCPLAPFPSGRRGLVPRQPSASRRARRPSAGRPSRAGESTLLLAPTGSGKTLAAFLVAIDRLVREAPGAERERDARPLRLAAQGARGRRRAEPPRAARRASPRRRGARASSSASPRSTSARATRPPSERARMARAPADILITTPESLYLLLTSAARETLAAVETVIVDEIHALVADQARRAPGAVARAARGAARARARRRSSASA